MLTTKDIIKILPLDEEYKNELFLGFDELEEDVKSNLTDMLWEAYITYYNMLLEKNIQEGLLLAAEGKGEQRLDGEYYKKMVKKTEDELQANMTQKSSAVDLEAARDAMQKIVAEINASKVTLKKPSN